MSDDAAYKIIWTIGHSTHPLEEFLEMLASFDISLLVDVRRYPGSKRHPQFNTTDLALSLKEKGIRYLHFPALGGRRSPVPESRNTAWRNSSFRGYADYMETGDFHTAIKDLATEAIKTPTAYMCSEAPWWRCHRALISDFLKVNGWKVMHIIKPGKADEHPYTSASKIVHGKLDYTKNSLLL